MLTSLDAAKAAREAVEIVTGRSVDTVVGCEKANDGFLIRVEITESKGRIGDNDLVGTYEVFLDKKTGELLSCQRTQRYRRGDAARAA
jgi:hypothetical protein